MDNETRFATFETISKVNPKTLSTPIWQNCIRDLELIFRKVLGRQNRQIKNWSSVEIIIDSIY